MGADRTDHPATNEQHEKGPEFPGTFRGVLRHALPSVDTGSVSCNSVFVPYLITGYNPVARPYVAKNLTPNLSPLLREGLAPGCHDGRALRSLPCPIRESALP